VGKVIVIPVAIALLTLFAYATTDAYRVATLDVALTEERPQEVSTVEYTIEGLKCRGMSMAAARILSGVPGVVSITTYVRTHTAIVEYDPGMTDAAAIAEALNRPVVVEGESHQVFRVVETRERG